MDDSPVLGCVLGTAVGDALGLPYEGVTRRRLTKLLGPPDRHRFVLGRGMISDDTEHTCLVGQALIVSGSDVDAFRRDLARRLRWWFASLPAGIGRATARACLKLWLGAKPDRSGVYSAGNGPAMRSAIIGAYFDDVDRMVEFVLASAGLTHTDPKAEFGAIAVALATHMGRNAEDVDGDLFVRQLTDLVGPEGEEFVRLMQVVVESVSAGESTLDYAAENGWDRGVSGYTYQTVPVVIHAWLSHPRDYRSAVTSVICCGGDADTTAAIVGGIVGAATGESGIPPEWLSGISEWPRSVNWMRRLASQLATTQTGRAGGRPVEVSWFASLCRNLFFLVIVLLHGFRRLLPPY